MFITSEAIQQESSEANGSEPDGAAKAPSGILKEVIDGHIQASY